MQWRAVCPHVVSISPESEQWSWRVLRQHEAFKWPHSWEVYWNLFFNFHGSCCCLNPKKMNHYLTLSSLWRSQLLIAGAVSDTNLTDSVACKPQDRVSFSINLRWQEEFSDRRLDCGWGHDCVSVGFQLNPGACVSGKHSANTAFAFYTTSEVHFSSIKSSSRIGEHLSPFLRH